MERLMSCSDCGNALTDEELHYYLGRCEKCERAYHDRIDAWRAGGDDTEFDEAFGVPKPVQH